MNILSSTPSEHQNRSIHGDRQGAMQAKTTFVPLLKKRLGFTIERENIRTNARLS